MMVELFNWLSFQMEDLLDDTIEKQLIYHIKYVYLFTGKKRKQTTNYSEKLSKYHNMFG